MKAIMYHYVRMQDERYPYFTYLSFDNFRRQLDYFSATGRLVGRSEFEDALASGDPLPDVYIPTFDDGLIEHSRLVMPELVSRGTFGIFFPCVCPLVEEIVLDVHRIHLLLGRQGGASVHKTLKELLIELQVDTSSLERFLELTYQGQRQGPATTFKRMLNYGVKADVRSMLLDKLCAGILPQDASLSLYMKAEDVQQLHHCGMIVGSHGWRHELLSTLPAQKQENCISMSLDVLRNILNHDVEWFCYPYGGNHSFDRRTQETLEAHGIRYAFSVDPRDIEGEDVKSCRLALPRYDCNLFPFGSATGPV